MSRALPVRSLLLLLPVVVVACSPQSKPGAVQSPVARGEYLVGFGGCSDCHSPKVFTPTGPVVDSARLLSGHPASDPLPALPAGVVGADPTRWGAIISGDFTAWSGPWGTSFAANLTPDRTGLAGWTDSLFIATMRTGKHFGTGRSLLPPMPWFNLNFLSDDDLRALLAYLRSIKPVANAVPAPIPPGPAS